MTQDVIPSSGKSSGKQLYFQHHCFLIGRIWYNERMTRDDVKEILDRVLTWPPERQADVAHVVEIMEEQDESPLRLSDKTPPKCAVG